MENKFFYNEGIIMRELICLIGPSGAGKSTAARILSEEFGYKEVSSSPYIRLLKEKISETQEYNYDSNELIGAVSKYYKNGFNEFMSIIFQKYETSKTIVWDSCINIHNIKLVLDLFDKVSFLCLTAPMEVRVRRVMQRPHFVNKTFDEVFDAVMKVDQYERCLGVGDLMLLSDWTISTDTMDELLIQIRNFIMQCKPTLPSEKVFACNYESEFKDYSSINISPLEKYLNKTNGMIV